MAVSDGSQSEPGGHWKEDKRQAGALTWLAWPYSRTGIGCQKSMAIEPFCGAVDKMTSMEDPKPNGSEVKRIPPFLQKR
jgi:hypothetical protein